MTTTNELPTSGRRATRVTDGRRTGTLIRYETAHRTRWAVVQWDGKPFADREYPARIQLAD
jgi:hypothetical protein